MQQTISEDLRESVRRRMEFIEFRVFWEGRINRRDLSDKFDTSEQQASADLARYQELAPDMIIYDKSVKAYLPSANFSPCFLDPSARKYLSQLRSISDGIVDTTETWIGAPPPYAAVPFLRRRTSWETLKPLTDAIRENQSVEIDYRSFTNPTPHRRRIAPHSLVFDGYRWHCRAWCFEREEFRDFSLPRIDRIGAQYDCEIDSENDLEWNHFVTLKIAPNPYLTPEQQELIRLEYGMEGGATSIDTRISLVFYVKVHLRLNETASKENSKWIHLHMVNADEVEEIIKEVAEKQKLMNSGERAQ